MKKFIAGLLMMPCVAYAQYYSGNTLLEKMRSSDVSDRFLALGYIMGVSDMGQGVIHCSGQNVTAGQTRDVIRKYLEQNPQIRDISADTIASVALGQAWPCPKDNKRNGVTL